MNVLCLGGAGMICREAVADLAAFSSFDHITVADSNEAAGREVVARLADPRVDFIQVDVRDRDRTISQMKDYDIVMDGTAITLNGLSTECIAEAGCHGINLNGFGEEARMDPVFRAHRRCCVPGFGMTPGVTQLMAMDAARRLDRVTTVRISHGAFRPIAYSPSITETTIYEYDPDLPGRVVFENGTFIQVPPFARPRQIQLPAPYGLTTQYIIPHAETVTLAKTLAAKGVELIEVRGTWPAKNMALIKALYEWGMLANPAIAVNGGEIGIMDCIAAYLRSTPAGRETERYGYALHVEVAGQKDGQQSLYTYTHTHPASDGGDPQWSGLRSYTRNVAIPFAIGTEMIGAGLVDNIGILYPEEAFDPQAVFAQLERRGILVQLCKD